VARGGGERPALPSLQAEGCWQIIIVAGFHDGAIQLEILLLIIIVVEVLGFNSEDASIISEYSSTFCHLEEAALLLLFSCCCWVVGCLLYCYYYYY